MKRLVCLLLALLLLTAVSGCVDDAEPTPEQTDSDSYPAASGYIQIYEDDDGIVHQYFIDEVGVAHEV